MQKRIHIPPEQRGQSLVELGISMIVLLFLLSGAINFGIAFYDYVAITDAAQEGALYGSIFPAEDELGTLNTIKITARVQQSSSSPVDLSAIPNGPCPPGPGANVICVSTPSGTCPGNLLKVTIEYYVPITMPIAGIFTNAIHLKTSATSTILKSLTTNCP